MLAAMTHNPLSLPLQVWYNIASVPGSGFQLGAEHRYRSSHIYAVHDADDHLLTLCLISQPTTSSRLGKIITPVLSHQGIGHQSNALCARQVPTSPGQGVPNPHFDLFLIWLTMLTVPDPCQSSLCT